MACRFAEYIERGWLDASERGRITGEIWLRGKDEPLRLDLKGYPMADLAGLLISFENPAPQEGDAPQGLQSNQKGVAGDITASRKTVQGQPPYHRDNFKTVNALYIEWYSETNGRMVIEAVGFRLSVHGSPLWQLTEEDELLRQQAVANGMAGFMDRLEETMERQMTDAEDGSWTPMDEFAWEKSLKESDERTDQYMALLDQYKDHPERDRIVAREMGWDSLEDLLDADERGVFDEEQESDPEESDFEEQDELTPDPLTEGVDWIRVEDGDIRHPLAHRAFEMSIRLHHLIRDLGVEKEESAEGSTEPLQILSFAAHMLSAKLAGALNSLGYDRDMRFMAGMIVAQLKRALSHFNEAVHRLDEVSRKEDTLKEPLAPFRDELFAIREEMLRLMDRFRQMIR